MSRKKPALVARFFYLINNLIALATWVAYLAWFINPSSVPIAGILALAVPAFIVLNVIFVLIWLVFFRRYIWLSLITIALGWFHISGLIAWNNSSHSKANDTIRVMTYNTHYYYANHPWKNYADVEEVSAFTKSVDPDIFCMQEFQKARKWVPDYKLKYRFISTHPTSHIAIYSAFPFIRTGEVDFPNKNEAYEKFIFGDVVRDSDTMRIIAAHLAPFGLETKDLRNIKNFDQLDEEAISKSSQNVFKQLSKAYKKRGEQVNTLAKFIEESPFPVILCGDLNDTPTSYTYRKLTRHLKDTFRQAGAGFGTSHVKFKKYKLPLRIDHIFTSEDFSCLEWKVSDVEYSDHHPVYADLYLDSSD